LVENYNFVIQIKILDFIIDFMQEFSMSTGEWVEFTANYNNIFKILLYKFKTREFFTGFFYL